LKFIRIFCVPQSIHGLPSERQLDALEEFWDSEHPRLGEVGAKGWAAWVSSGRPEPAAPPRGRQSSAVSSRSDPYAQWAAQELEADRISTVPARSTDETSDDDPYSVVMFSEIRPLLVTLLSAQSKSLFRLCWLSFLGLHIPGLTASMSSLCTDDRWASTYLTSPAHLSAVFPSPNMARRQITADAHAGVVVGREREYAKRGPWGPVRAWTRDGLNPLDNLGTRYGESGKTNPTGLNGWWSREDVQDLDASFVRRIFYHCRYGAHDVEWDSLALAFEACIDVKA
jgi:hypothetical protein